MVKKTGLGKGMAALLPVVEEDGKVYFTCPIEDIRPNPDQPRKTFREEKLQELAGSIREQGIIQPLVVRRKGNGYELIAGERRWRAAQKAGLHEVPVIIQEVSEETALELALIENIQRQDLNPVEEAQAYQQLIDRFSLSQEELAKKVGKERSTVANALRLLKLPDSLKADLVEERLSMGHVRALLPVADAVQLERLRDEAIRKGLSVRETENLVKRLRHEPKKETATSHDVELADLVNRLKRRLGAKVAVRGDGKKGRIEIFYHTGDELDRLLELLEG